MLKTPRDVRRELVSLYKQVKRNQVDPQQAGRLTYILNSIVAIDVNLGVDERLRQIEAHIANAKPNGAGRGAHL